MTFAEFLNRLRAIAGDRYCHARVEASAHAGRRISVTWTAYIDGVGSVGQVDMGRMAEDPDHVLDGMRRLATGFTAVRMQTSAEDVGSPVEASHG